MGQKNEGVGSQEGARHVRREGRLGRKERGIEGGEDRREKDKMTQ